MAITTLKFIQNAKVWGVLENSGYLLPDQMGTEIFKIEEEMTEKMKLKVVCGIFCSQYTLIDPLSHS